MQSEEVEYSQDQEEVVVLEVSGLKATCSIFQY